MKPNMKSHSTDGGGTGTGGTGGGHREGLGYSTGQALFMLKIVLKYQL